MLARIIGLIRNLLVQHTLSTIQTAEPLDIYMLLPKILTVLMVEPLIRLPKCKNSVEVEVLALAEVQTLLGQILMVVEAWP